MNYNYGTDVYNNPSQHGLKIIGECQDPDAFYSFDMVVVWEDENGKRYWATDAGCSCPGWFEEYTSVDKLTTGTDAELIDFVLAWADTFGQYPWESDRHETAKSDALSMLRRIGVLERKQ